MQQVRSEQVQKTDRTEKPERLPHAGARCPSQAAKSYAAEHRVHVGLNTCGLGLTTAAPVQPRLEPEGPGR